MERKDAGRLKAAAWFFWMLAIICQVAALCWFFAPDRSPGYAEELSQAKAAAASWGTDTVYWTAFGRDYHFDPDCPSLSMSKTLYEGDASDAFAANRHRPCNFCVPQGVKTE